jgi:NADH-quinone oxidoreductase subunit A
MTTPTIIAGYLALFAIFGLVFLFFHLLIGKFLRPKNPNTEKLEVYECGEPTIGSSFVQFDIRFYVVALLFIIFDVEISLFFPWATVFGKATHLKNEDLQIVQSVETTGAPTLTPAASGLFRELGVPTSEIPQATAAQRDSLRDQLGREPSDVEAATYAVRSSANSLAIIAIFDILVFFAVLMMGFVYVWRRGDLDWVRAVDQSRAPPVERVPPAAALEQEPVLSM